VVRVAAARCIAALWSRRSRSLVGIENMLTKRNNSVKKHDSKKNDLPRHRSAGGGRSRIYQSGLGTVPGTGTGTVPGTVPVIVSTVAYD